MVIWGVYGIPHSQTNTPGPSVEHTGEMLRSRCLHALELQPRCPRFYSTLRWSNVAASSPNGGFDGKIICKWWRFPSATFDCRRALHEFFQSICCLEAAQSPRKITASHYISVLASAKPTRRLTPRSIPRSIPRASAFEVPTGNSTGTTGHSCV